MTPSPLKDIDPSQFNVLLIGMYPDSPAGRTGLDHHTYRRLILHRQDTHHQRSSSDLLKIKPHQALHANSSTEATESTGTDSLPSATRSCATPATEIFSPPAQSTSPVIFDKLSASPITSTSTNEPPISSLPNDTADPSKQLLFCCHDLIHTGQLWDVYRGVLVSCDGTSNAKPVILKTMRPETFLYEYPPVDSDGVDLEDQGVHIQPTAIAAAFEENWIYRTFLPQLQGTVVPEYYGLFTWYKKDEGEFASCHRSLFAMLMEDVGDPDENLRGVPHSYTWDDRHRIDELYQALHRTAGIAHCNIQYHHILRNEHDRLSIVDFQESRVLKMYEDQFQLNLLKEDDGCLMFLLHTWREYVETCLNAAADNPCSNEGNLIKAPY